MGSWTIYDKTGATEKCTAKEVEYNGTFMGECFVTASIESPVPVDFQIGDYLTYRGERFEINYDPTVIKKASKNSTGDAFTYEDIKFNSLSDELTRCDFLDYVKDDNNIHFTSLPKFSFYASTVQDLADRIQANLDRIYTGSQKWTVSVHSDFSGLTDVNVEVNNITVWDALGLAYSKFEATFIIRGRTITIGTAGISAGSIFKYGKGNGLYEIERTAEKDQKIITRLRAYGSTRNLPDRYYATLIDPVVEAPIKEVEIGYENGVISGANITMDFDLVFESDTAYYQATINGASYQIKKHPNFAGLGYVKLTSEDDKLNVKAGAYLRMSDGLVTDGIPLKYKKPSGGTMPNNMAVQNLMLPGFPSTTLDPYIDSDNITALGIREGSVYFDGSTDGLPEIFPSMEGMTAEDLEEAGIQVSATGNLDEVVSAEQITDDGIPDEEGDIEKETFTITLKDIGFDINEYLTGETATISMKSGMCGGREFEIESVEKLGNNYVLTCNRVYDDGLRLFFPYSQYNIKSGDKFVLLYITMPDVYIQAASQRLKTEAEKYLAKNDYVRYSYSPKVDNIYMAKQHDEAAASDDDSIHDTLKEGDLFLFNDTDLGIDGSIIIDSLTIHEGGELGIPEYEVTLRNEKVVGSLERLQNQIDSIAGGGSGSGGIGGSGGYNIQQIQSIIKAYLNDLKVDIDGMYLRKDIDDTAEGIILFKKKIGSYDYLDGWEGIGWEIEETGAAELDSLKVRSDIYLGGTTGSSSFVSGFPNGSGWEIAPYKKTNAAGVEETKYRLEIDDINVRGSLRAYEFVISQLRGENDNVIFAGMMKVAYYDSESKRIYLDTEDGVLYNPFKAGDVLMMQRYGGTPTAENGYNVIKQYELVVSEAGVGSLSDGEDRLDWVTFTNFTGGLADVEEGDVLTRVDSITDSTRKGTVKVTTVDEVGAPYIDVVYGMKTDPDNCTKARVGNLTGITTKNGIDLTGVWGIYGSGAYFENTTIILDNGNTVEQQFSILNGTLESVISEIGKDTELEEGNVLANSTFSRDMQCWESTGDGVHLYAFDGVFLFDGDEFMSEKGDGADMYAEGSRKVLRIRNASVTQDNGMMSLPVRADSEEDGYTYSFSFFYKVLSGGTLTAGIPDSGLYKTETLEVTDEYKKYIHTGTWDEAGDFTVGFTGEILIYNVSLVPDTIADELVRMWTEIEQNAEQIALRATKEYVDAETGAIYEKYDAELSVMSDEIYLYVSQQISGVGQDITDAKTELEAEIRVQAGRITGYASEIDSIQNTIETAGWITSAEGNKLYAAKTLEDGDTLVSYINQSADSIKINANRINLNGAVTISMFDNSLQTTINGKLDSGDVGALAFKDTVSSGDLSSSLSSTINNAASDASDALSDALSAYNRANSAYSLANSASNDAKTAHNRADSAYNRASTAISNAAKALEEALAAGQSVKDLPSWSKEASIIQALQGASLIVGGYFATEYIDTSYIEAVRGNIGSFEIDQYGLKNEVSAPTAYISIGDDLTHYIRLNEASSPGLVDVRADGGLAVRIQAYGSGSIGLNVLAQAGSDCKAIRSFGSHVFYQRNDNEVWNAPGVLCAMCINKNGVLSNMWGNGLNATPRVTKRGTGKYQLEHSLGRTLYYPFVMVESSRGNYVSTIKSQLTNSFSYDIVDLSDRAVDADHYVIICGRNKYSS